MGHSLAISALRTQIRDLTKFDAVGNPYVPTLLLQGETGTGKGLVARVIHDSGPRINGPFLEVNCAAIPEALLEAELFGFEAGAFTDAKRAKPGLFEAASGGTLFLDEVDALSLLLQSKLLNAIEAKRIRRVGAVDRALGGCQAHRGHCLQIWAEQVSERTFPRRSISPTSSRVADITPAAGAGRRLPYTRPAFFAALLGGTWCLSQATEQGGRGMAPEILTGRATCAS